VAAPRQELARSAAATSSCPPPPHNAPRTCVGLCRAGSAPVRFRVQRGSVIARWCTWWYSAKPLSNPFPPKHIQLPPRTQRQRGSFRQAQRSGVQGSIKRIHQDNCMRNSTDQKKTQQRRVAVLYHDAPHTAGRSARSRPPLRCMSRRPSLRVMTAPSAREPGQQLPAGCSCSLLELVLQHLHGYALGALNGQAQGAAPHTLQQRTGRRRRRRARGAERAQKCSGGRRRVRAHTHPAERTRRGLRV